MWRLGPAWHDEAALARAWHAAAPFPHLVFDDVVAADALPALLDVLDEEPVDAYQGDLFAFEASTPRARTDGFRAIAEGFGATFAAPLARITGKSLARTEVRAYAYRVGHYLLPHSDHQADLTRAIAFAYYLPSPEPPVGGELELFACRREAGEIVATDSARVIAPAANRLVVFDVGDDTLHQVREVLGGLRISLAGWFYP